MNVPFRESIYELRRLLRYVRPYRARLAGGIAALALVGMAEGLIALMFTPLLDSVLTRSNTDSRMPLLKLPFSNGRIVYLNSFVPRGIQHIGAVFGISLIFLFVVKAVAEYFGVVEIQHVGQSATTDLRNRIYEKLVRQPIGFFQTQTTGRLMSTVINDVDRARSTLSDTLSSFFQYVFTFTSLAMVLLVTNWKMTLVSAIYVPMVLWPVSKLGRRIRRSVESSQSRLGELNQILQETLSGNRVVKAFGMERFEIGRFHEAARRLMRENMRWIRHIVLTSPLMDMLTPIVVVPLVLYARNQIRHHDARHLRHLHLRADSRLRTRERNGRSLPAI